MQKKTKIKLIFFRNRKIFLIICNLYLLIFLNKKYKRFVIYTKIIIMFI